MCFIHPSMRRFFGGSSTWQPAKSDEAAGHPKHRLYERCWDYQSSYTYQWQFLNGQVCGIVKYFPQNIIIQLSDVCQAPFCSKLSFLPSRFPVDLADLFIPIASARPVHLGASNARDCATAKTFVFKVRCKVPKGGSSGGTGIPLQPMGVEPGIPKTIYVE